VSGSDARDGWHSECLIGPDSWHSWYESANSVLALSTQECKLSDGADRLLGMTGLENVRIAYKELLEVTDTVGDEVGWLPTGCAGWAVRDLVHHLLLDAQRALVALGTPSDRTPDVDAVSYWQEWQPGTDRAGRAQRAMRIISSVWSTGAAIAEGYGETARAVLVAAERADLASVVGTQGHAITVDDLLTTLAVEATVHHLDLVDTWDAPGPSDGALTLVAETLDALLGPPAPLRWDATRWTLVGTGRAAPTADERAQLGEAVDRLPLFG
jgi:Mycothiol maleylpyruvate isomerase N-terminal domain